MDWTRILTAVFLVVMMVWLFPSMKHWVKNSPKGSSKEWLNASVLLAGVVLFVLFLMSIV